MAAPAAVEQDLFATPDKDFDVPMARTAPAHFADLSSIAEEHPELQDGLELEEEFVEPVPASATHTTPAIAVEPAVDEPEIIELDNGTVTIEKVKNGYEAVLEQADGGGREVFKGRTRNELLTNVLAAKLNATGQIRRLNKKLKVGGTPVDAPVPTVREPSISAKALNANDIFEIKTALESDPDKAFDLRFQKKYGMTEEEFVALVQDTRKKAIRGQEAHQELTIEAVSKEFLERNKDVYYPWEENGNNVMGWLAKNKLRRQVTKQDTFGSLSSELLDKGLYTVENLEEAVEDLKDSGLLLPPPEPEPQEEIVPTPASARVAVTPQQVPPAEPQNPRIVRQTRQPRGGLGLRPSSATVPTPEPSRAPSVDDLENASTDQINELFAAVRRHARIQPNRRS